MAKDAKMADGLSIRESLFCDHYLVTFDAQAAAVRAGYSPKSARVTGPQLLAKEPVQKELQRRRQRLAKKLNITAERVLEELSVLAYSNVEDFTVNDHGRLVLVEGADPAALRAVSSVKHKVRRTVKGDVATVEHEVEFKLWNKNNALQQLNDHLGLSDPENRPPDPDDELTEEEHAQRIVDLLRVAQRRVKAMKKDGGG